MIKSQVTFVDVLGMDILTGFDSRSEIELFCVGVIGHQHILLPGRLHKRLHLSYYHLSPAFELHHRTKHVLLFVKSLMTDFKTTRTLISLKLACISRIGRVSSLASVVPRIKRNCIQPFRSFLATLLHGIEPLQQRQVEHFACRLEANQKLLECFVWSWAACKPRWRGSALNNVFGFVESLRLWAMDGSRKVTASSSVSTAHFSDAECFLLLTHFWCRGGLCPERKEITCEEYSDVR